MFSFTTVSDAFESHAVFTRGIQSSLGSPIAKRAKQMKLKAYIILWGSFGTLRSEQGWGCPSKQPQFPRSADVQVTSNPDRYFPSTWDFGLPHNRIKPSSETTLWHTNIQRNDHTNANLRHCRCVARNRGKFQYTHWPEIPLMSPASHSCNSCGTW